MKKFFLLFTLNLLFFVLCKAQTPTIARADAQTLPLVQNINAYEGTMPNRNTPKTS